MRPGLVRLLLGIFIVAVVAGGAVLVLRVLTSEPAPTPTLAPTESVDPPSGTSTTVASTAAEPTRATDQVAAQAPDSVAEPPVTATPAQEVLDPMALISQESLFAALEDLTEIQPYSGWRNSASSGEVEALDYISDRLSEFDYLRDMGMELEEQSFRVFLGTEFWESRLRPSEGNSH